MGGEDAGAIDPGSHDYALWEKRVDALLVLLATRGHFSVDGLRRALEDLGPQAFETMSYYERWIAAVNRNMIEAGAWSLAELAARMEQVARRGPTYAEASDAG
jgi:Nitrile hydratase beta subunit